VSDTKVRSSDTRIVNATNAQLAVLSGTVPAGKFSLLDAMSQRNLSRPEDFANLESPDAKDLLKDAAVELGNESVPVTAAELYVERLKVLRALLKGAGQSTLADFSNKLIKSKSIVDGVFQENLSKLMAHQRELETSWRQLDAFYKTARVGPNARVPLAVWPASTESLTDDAEFQKFDKAVPKQSKISMRELYGLIVLPGWLRNKASLEKFGKLAREAKAILITDAPDDYERARRECDGGQLADIKGTELWKRHVVIVGNPLQIRQSHLKYEQEQTGLYLSPAILFAAKVVNGDAIEGMATAQAGKRHELLLEGPSKDPLQLKWRLDDKDHINADFKRSIISLAYVDRETIAFWGIENLSDEDPWNQYTVMRVREYIEKCLIHYMNQNTYVPNTDDNRRRLKDKIQEFLTANSGDQDPLKMLTGGRVVHLVSETKNGQVNPSVLDIKLELNFKVSVKRVILDVTAKEDEKAWNIAKTEAHNQP
jgi:hypothetical protein